MSGEAVSYVNDRRMRRLGDGMASTTGGGTLRFDVYRGGELAATFVYGAAPRYYGPYGREIATLIEATPVVYNLWTQESHVDPCVERADWWAARIISAPLAQAGFVLRPLYARSAHNPWWHTRLRKPHTGTLRVTTTL